MRNIILFFVFFNVVGWCQNLSGYYPLEIGNIWEYWDPWDSLFIFRDTIVGDSTASNDTLYQIMKREYWSGEIYFSLLRFNDNKLYGHSSEGDGIYYDFTKTKGDTLRVRTNGQDTVEVYRITADYNDYFYGRLLRHVDYYTESTMTSFYNIDRVVDSIGLIYMDFEPGIQYFLRGALINGVQYGTITNVNDEKTNPEKFILSQNYPNPFNSITRIEFIIPERNYVSIEVHDILGRLIKVLADEEKNAGNYKVAFNSEGLAGGVYFYTIQAGTYKETKKMIFLP